MVENLPVNVKCRSALKTLFLYFNLYIRVMLNSLSWPFISIFFNNNNSFNRMFCSTWHTHSCICTLSENIIFISTSFRNRWFFFSTVPQMNFIFSDKLHILYLSCNVKKPQTQPPNSLKRAETSVVLTVFWWCYRFLSSLKMHLITGELYLDQWQYITKLNLINAVWLLKQN